MEPEERVKLVNEQLVTVVVVVPTIWMIGAESVMTEAALMMTDVNSTPPLVARKSGCVPIFEVVVGRMRLNEVNCTTLTGVLVPVAISKRQEIEEAIFSAGFFTEDV